MTSLRQYDLVIFGATGYTGKFTAEHVARYLPTDLKWAISGRSADKLAVIAKELRSINPDRPAPAIEVCPLEKTELDALAKKTTLLVTTVGPYMKYGTPVLEACANNGTHYLDCTGEIPWYKEMLDKYHDTARRTGAIIIPNCGMDSIPADLSTLLVASRMRAVHSLPTREVVACTRLNSTPSGGTLSTFLSIFEHYSASYLARAARPYSISPLRPNHSRVPPAAPGLVGKLFGVRHDPHFGWLTNAVMGGVDTCIAHRSWGLLAESSGGGYGPHFRFTEWAPARGFLVAAFRHYLLVAAFLSLIVPPWRWLLRKLVFAPGEGPTAEQYAKESLDFRTVAYPDTEDPELRKKRVSSKFTYQGSIYVFTGICLGEGAMCLLRGSKDSEARRRGGGVLTTACLGEELADRLRSVGCTIEVSDA